MKNFKKTSLLLLPIILIVIIYNIIFSPVFINHYGNYLLRTIFNKIEIHFECKNISLFRGLEIDNISIFDQVTNTPIIRLKKFKINYFLPAVINGDIGIREISLIEPEIYLYKINERWNYESLLGNSTKKVEIEEEKKEESMPTRINFYIPLRVFFYFNIQKFSLYYKNIKQIDNLKSTVKEQLEIKDLSLYLGFITKVFDHIPLNYKALELIEDFIFLVNPSEPLTVYYQKNQELTGQPLIKIKLSKVHKNDYFNKIIIDTNLMKFSHSTSNFNLQTQFQWDIQYIPQKKQFEIKEISLKNQTKYLFYFKGKFYYDGDDWYIDIYQNSNVPMEDFSLSPYGQILSILTENKINLDGIINIKEFLIKGKLKDLNSILTLTIPNFKFNQHKISNFNLNLEGNFDLSNKLSFLYDKENEQNSHVFGFIKNLKFNQFNLYYNNAYIDLKGTIAQTSLLELNINGFQLGMFLYPHLQGILDGNISIETNNDFSQIDLITNLYLKKTIYVVDNYFSREQNLKLNAQGNIVRNNHLNIYLNVNELSANDEKNLPLIFIKGETWLTFNDLQNYKIHLEKLEINYKSLEEKLPVNLKSSLRSVNKILNEGIYLNGNFDLTFFKTNNYKANFNIKIPNLHPEAIHINLDIDQNPYKWDFNQVSLIGWNNSLILKLKGMMKKNQKDWIPNLKLFLQYQNPQITEIYKNLFLRGRILLEATYQENQIQGKLDINHFDIKFIMECEKENKELCKYYALEDLNLSLPFSHILNQKSFITYQKYQDFQLPEANFTIKSIKSNYSLDNSFYKEGFFFLGSNNKPAIEGFIQYKENILWIPYLKLYSYLKNSINGNIELRNFYFNLSDLNLQNIHLSGKFYIINYDLNSLFPKAESVFKGNVSAYINFYAHQFDDLIRNLELKTSIYQISKDFAGFAVRIIAPTIVAAVVNETLKINSIDLELKNGVVYSYIKVKSPGFFSLSRLIKPMDDEIKQERIPLAEFIKRSKKEIQMEVE